MAASDDSDYRKYLQLILRRRYLFVGIFLAVMTGATIVNLSLPKQYQAISTIFVEKGFLNDIVKGLAIPPSNDGNVKVLAYTMKSRKLLEKVIRELKVPYQGEVEMVARDFQERTVINVKDAEGLFTISFRHSDPVLARNFVNSLISHYASEYISSQKEDTYGATRFLSEQVNLYKAKLDAAEEQVNQFRREKGVLLADSPAQLQADIDRLQQKIDDAILRRNQLEAMQILARKTEDPYQVRLWEMQKKMVELRSRFTDRYPEVVDLREEMEHVSQQMKRKDNFLVPVAATTEVARIAAEIRGLDDMERSYRRAIEEKRARQKVLPTVLTALEELERYRNAQKSVYEQFVARLQQSEVSREAEVQNKSVTFRIVDPAVVPTKPFSPKPEKILLLGIVLGLLAGVGVLLVLDYLDTSVRSPEAFKVLGIPVLAVVQKMQDPDEQKAYKRKDWCIFTLSGSYFLILLAAFHPGLIEAFKHLGK